MQNQELIADVVRGHTHTNGIDKAVHNKICTEGKNRQKSVD